MVGLTTGTRQFALQGGEVGVRGVVLQLPGHLRLLGLSTAAPHGSTPSHRIRGSPKAGPDDVRHLSWVLRYMDDACFGTSGCVYHHRASSLVTDPTRDGVQTAQACGVARLPRAGQLRKM